MANFRTDIGKVVPRDRSRPVWLVPPVVADGSITLIFGKADVGKSWLSAAIALGVAQEGNIGVVPGMQFVRHGPVLYIDAEDHRETIEERIMAIYRGVELDPSAPSNIEYWRLEGIIAEAADRIRKFVRQKGVRLVILDSFNAAVRGSSISVKAAKEVIDFLRSLGTAVVVIGHVTKSDTEKETMPYGTRIIFDRARVVWRLNLDEAADGSTVHVLTNTKSNWSAKAEPICYAMRFESRPDPATSQDRLYSVTFDHAEADAQTLDDEGLLFLHMNMKTPDAKGQRIITTTEARTFLDGQFPGRSHNALRLLRRLERKGRIYLLSPGRPGRDGAPAQWTVIPSLGEETKQDSPTEPDSAETKQDRPTEPDSAGEPGHGLTLVKGGLE